jgi:hypothetical protein
MLQLETKIADCVTLYDLDRLREEIRATFGEESDERLELLSFCTMVEERILFG